MIPHQEVDLAADWIQRGETLLVAPRWVQAHCVVPDSFDKGQPFVPVDWQLWCLLNAYRVKPTAKFGQLAPAFVYRRSQIVLPQKAGKAPHSASRICLEAVGPALFGGWAKGGETWDCRDHGCGCGFVHEYQPGEAMGMRWPTPLIQITAYSEEQTDNIYDALRPMIDRGPLSEQIPKTGEEFIRLPNDGRIDAVTSNAKSRLGQRVTYAPQDETGIWTRVGGMTTIASTQRRGLAGMGGRAEETTNGWDPTEGSVAQRTAERSVKDIFRFHPLPPENLRYEVKKDRQKIHQAVYQGSHWVDLDSIEAEAAELIETDPGEAERFYGNRIVAGSAKAFDLSVFREGRGEDSITDGRLVVAGFDGAQIRDSTGLIVTDVETGHQLAYAAWERPRNIPDDAEWNVPVEEVNEAVKEMFARWDVWRLYADPPYWGDEINEWAGLYGEDKVVRWWTNNRKKIAFALRTYKQAISAGSVTYGGEYADLLEEHIGNSVKKPTKMRADDDVPLWLIGKPASDSKEKIDLAMAATLSWTCRGDAISAGVLKEEESYGTAAFQGGGTKRRKRTPKSEYLPCVSCGKPIHPKLHAPDAPEAGRCLKCRT